MVIDITGKYRQMLRSSFGSLPEDPVERSSRRVSEMVNEAEALLLHARRSAEQIRAKARREAEKIVRKAQEEKKRILEDARTRAERLVSSAGREAERIIDEARRAASEENLALAREEVGKETEALMETLRSLAASLRRERERFEAELTDELCEFVMAACRMVVGVAHDSFIEIFRRNVEELVASFLEEGGAPRLFINPSDLPLLEGGLEGVEIVADEGVPSGECRIVGSDRAEIYSLARRMDRLEELLPRVLYCASDGGVEPQGEE